MSLARLICGLLFGHGMIGPLALCTISHGYVKTAAIASGVGLLDSLLVQALETRAFPPPMNMPNHCQH